MCVDISFAYMTIANRTGDHLRRMMSRTRGKRSYTSSSCNNRQEIAGGTQYLVGAKKNDSDARRAGGEARGTSEWRHAGKSEFGEI